MSHAQFIINTIKFTELDSIRFSYKHRNYELYFYISDTDYGIPKDKQESIFGRFVKQNAFVQGTGLGLSICQTLVRNMGDNIGVESEKGKDSLFWFILQTGDHRKIGKKTAFEPIVVKRIS